MTKPVLPAAERAALLAETRDIRQQLDAAIAAVERLRAYRLRQLGVARAATAGRDTDHAAAEPADRLDAGAPDVSGQGAGAGQLRGMDASLQAAKDAVRSLTERTDVVEAEADEARAAQLARWHAEDVAAKAAAESAIVGVP